MADRTETFDAYTESQFRFSAEEADKLMAGGGIFKLKKREVVYNAGDPNDLVYYLL